LNEVGISYVTGISNELKGICGNYIHLLVMDFGYQQNFTKANSNLKILDAE